MLRVTSLTSLAELAHAIAAGEDKPVFGLELEFPTLTDPVSLVPIGRSLEPQALRSIHVLAKGFVELQGAPHLAFHRDHVLGTLSTSGTPSVLEPYTVLWTPLPAQVADAQLALVPGTTQLTRFAVSWSEASLHNLFDVSTLLVVFIGLSGLASLAVQRIYPLPDTSGRRALLFGLCNLLTPLCTFVVRVHALPEAMERVAA
jgi:fluoride ion exporter CrcB/FEX